MYPCDPVVSQLNDAARAIAAARALPTVDLHAAVTDTCGARYVNCSICRMSPCSYHYTAPGYTMLARTVGAAVRGLLTVGE